jgi:hydroxymethylpyrimidine pyrophosphatase-like HAD family hydrolase
LVRRFGIDGQLVFNRAALMLLPSGINKARGIRRALHELGRSEHSLIAFGDAENDIPMLMNAEVGVAASGSVQSVSALVDDFVSHLVAPAFLSISVRS